MESDARVAHEKCAQHLFRCPAWGYTRYNSTDRGGDGVQICFLYQAEESIASDASSSKSEERKVSGSMPTCIDVSFCCTGLMNPAHREQLPISKIMATALRKEKFPPAHMYSASRARYCCNKLIMSGDKGLACASHVVGEFELKELDIANPLAGDLCGTVRVSWSVSADLCRGDGIIIPFEGFTAMPKTFGEKLTRLIVVKTKPDGLVAGTRENRVPCLMWDHARGAVLFRLGRSVGEGLTTFLVLRGLHCPDSPTDLPRPLVSLAATKGRVASTTDFVFTESILAIDPIDKICEEEVIAIGGIKSILNHCAQESSGSDEVVGMRRLPTTVQGFLAKPACVRRAVFSTVKMQGVFLSLNLKFANLTAGTDCGAIKVCWQMCYSFLSEDELRVNA